MKIVIGDVWSRIITTDTEALATVRMLCSARPNGYRFMPKYKKGYWDGYISLMRGINHFPTGLLQTIVDTLKEKGYKIEFEYNLEFVQHRYVKPDTLNGITLRDYQVEAANTLLDHVRGVAKMATNSGKTEVMAALACAIDEPTVVLLHRKELLYQTMDRFTSRLSEDVYVVGDGKFFFTGVHNTHVRITIAMIQSLANRNDIEEMFDGNMVVMVDECHHASSQQMMDVLYRIPGTYRFGFSGTPLKRDNLSDLKLMAMTGPVVVDIGNDFLIEEGYSAVPKITFFEIPGDHYELSYPEAYKAAIVNDTYRNDSICSLCEMYRDKQILVLVNHVEHGQILEKMLRHVNAVFLHGGLQTDVRRDRITYMRTHSSGVTIATPIFDEGIDIPNIDVVVLAGGGKSNVKLLQRIGRGMRKKDGDNELLVFDFLDTGHDHLLNHSEKRLDVYEQEGFEVTLK